MKGAATLALAAALAAVSTRAPAQVCQFGVVWGYSGLACNQAGGVYPTVTGSYSNGVDGCSVTLTLGVPPLCCPIGRFLILGEPANIPLPGACALLVSPQILVSVPASPTSVTLPLPSDPAMVGLAISAQGAVIVFTGGFGFYYNFSKRLNIAFV